jgi:Trk K+ transport system NAD-binding subunit
VDVIVVAIGDDFEATPLTVASMQNLDAKRIVMSARSPVHEHILWPPGLEKIILPADKSGNPTGE